MISTCVLRTKSAARPAPFYGNSFLLPFTEDWGDQRCHTALPYVCKRSNSSGETQPPDLPPSVLGGCPTGWNQFLNKVGSWEGTPREPGERMGTVGWLSLRSLGRLAATELCMTSCLSPPASLPMRARLLGSEAPWEVAGV